MVHFACGDAMSAKRLETFDVVAEFSQSGAAFIAEFEAALKAMSKEQLLEAISRGWDYDGDMRTKLAEQANVRPAEEGERETRTDLFAALLDEEDP